MQSIELEDGFKWISKIAAKSFAFNVNFVTKHFPCL